jgi:hypothetical protein
VSSLTVIEAFNVVKHIGPSFVPGAVSTPPEAFNIMETGLMFYAPFRTLVTRTTVRLLSKPLRGHKTFEVNNNENQILEEEPAQIRSLRRLYFEHGCKRRSRW